MVSLKKAWSNFWSPKNSNPYAQNPTSQPTNSPHPNPSAAATLPFQRPASVREQRDFLAEAREVAGRDHVTGKKKAASFDTRDGDGGTVAESSRAAGGPEAGYAAYVMEMKRRREHGMMTGEMQQREFYAPAPRVVAEYYSPQGSGR